MNLFDVHAHLTHPKIAPKIDKIIQMAVSRGVNTIICNGLNPQDNEAVRALTARYPNHVKAAFGFYPVDVVLPQMLADGVDYPRDDEPLTTAEEGVSWLTQHIHEAFAMGEIGLDGYWVPELYWGKQEEVFCQLVELALHHDKPIIVHTRKRERRTLDLLKECGASRVNWHCFGGKLKLARQIADHGHFLSIPANCQRAQGFSKLLSTLPRDQLLLETDSPYLPPQRDTLNEPANVDVTVALAQELWQIERPRVVEQFAANFQQLFRCCP